MQYGHGCSFFLFGEWISLVENDPTALNNVRKLLTGCFYRDIISLEAISYCSSCNFRLSFSPFQYFNVLSM